MRILVLAIAAAAVALTGCNQDRRDGEPADRQMGREAHRAADDIKQGADKAAQEAREAGKNFKEGWEEGKHDPPRRDDDRRPPARPRR